MIREGMGVATSLFRLLTYIFVMLRFHLKIEYILAWIPEGKEQIPIRINQGE